MSGIISMFMAKAPITYITNETSTGSSTFITFTDPHSSESAGDVILALLGAVTSSATTWTSIGTERRDQGAKPSLLVSTITGGIGDPAWNFYTSTSTNKAGYLVRFRAAQYDTIGTVATISADGTLTLPGITSAGGVVVAFICAQNACTASTPSGFTEIANASLGSQRFVIAYKRVDAGATGAVDSTVTSLSGNTIGGVLIGLK